MVNRKNNKQNYKQKNDLFYDNRWTNIWSKRAFYYKKMKEEFSQSPNSLRKIYLGLKIKYHDFLLERSLMEYWMFFRNLHLVIPKYLNVLLMIFIFFTSPKNLFKYSWRKSLPTEKMRDSHEDNLFDLYKPEVFTNCNLINCERSIYMRGYAREIPLGNNIILVNSEITSNNRHCTFVSADESTFNYYLENKVDCIYIRVVNINNKGVEKVVCNPSRILKKNYKMITLKLKCNNHMSQQTHGSGVMSIFAFSMLSKKLKVYGWNFYKKKKLSNMNFLELIWNIFFYLKDYYSKIHVEYSLTNLFYAYYFDKIKNLSIEGNLDYFKNDLYNKIITPRLKSIFLN